MTELAGIGIALILVALVFALFGFALMIAVYVISSLGQMKMLQKLGYEHPVFAWIPILNTYSLGWIAEQHNNGKPTRKYSKIYLILQIVSIGISVVSSVITNVLTLFMEIPGSTDSDAVIGAIFTGGIMSMLTMIPASVIAIAISVFGYYILYRAFQIFDPDRAVLYLVLSIVVSLAQPIVVLLASKKDPQNLRETCPAYAKYNPNPYGCYDGAYAQYGQYQNPQYRIDPQYGQYNQQNYQQPPQQNYTANNQNPQDPTY